MSYDIIFLCVRVCVLVSDCPKTFEQDDNLITIYHKCCVISINPTAWNHQHSILEILYVRLFELVKIKMHADRTNLLSDILN